MSRKIYNFQASFNDELKTDEMIIKRNSYVRQNFHIPKSMAPLDFVFPTEKIGLTCLQTIRDDSYIHYEYDKSKVNAMVDKMKEDAITAIAESLQTVDTTNPVTMINNGLVFNVLPDPVLN